MNPAKSELGQGVLGEFYQHQSHFLRLLEVGDKKNLDAKVVRVEFFKLLKLRLGEAMEFVVVHQQRHLEQALRALLSTTPV